MLSDILLTCIVIRYFHFLLFCNRKSEIEAKRKQEEEERKKREGEEKRIQVNVLAVCGFWRLFGGCWVVVWVLKKEIENLFHSSGSLVSLLPSFYK